MTGILNARILASVAMLVFVGAVVASSTGAFFSDTETSTGNTFTAGAIDLQIDNSSYGFDWNNPDIVDPQGNWIENNFNSWGLTDLDGELFFRFVDLKPGDYGEDTISLHVNDNDAYACMAFNLTGTPENGQNEPEAEVDATAGANEGELQNYLSFLFWFDDGDNVLEDGEQVIDELSGLPGEIFTGGWLPISEGGDTPLPGDTTQYIGKGWCFGTITPTFATPAVNPNGPTADNTGFTCTGADGDHNDAQTDGIVVDVGFYAVQSRNNDDFRCVDVPPLDGEAREEVGAVLASFEAPGQTCNVTVEDGQSIQAAIDAASPGQVICVADGTHDTDTYPLRVNEDNLTLIAVNGPTNTAVLAGGVILDNPGTTLSGFHIDGQSTLLSETFGVYVNTAATGATVSHNIIEGNDTNPSRGIVTATGLSNVTIEHNQISDWFTGIFLNPSSNMVVAYNTVFSNAVGSANDGPTSNSIHHNVIRDNTAEGVGVSDSTVETAGSLAVNFNNIYGNPGANQMNNYDLGVDNGGFTVDAENNWWGDNTPANNINGAGAPADGGIDFDPFETSAFPEN